MTSWWRCLDPKGLLLNGVPIVAVWAVVASGGVWASPMPYIVTVVFVGNYVESYGLPTKLARTHKYRRTHAP